MDIDRRGILTSLAAATVATAAFSTVQAAVAPQKARNVVLVHGPFADGSC